MLGHRAPPGSHGAYGHRAPGALADAGAVVLLAAARRRTCRSSATSTIPSPPWWRARPTISSASAACRCRIRTLAARELERLMQDGFRGVELGSNINGAALGDPRFEPFFAAAEELDAARVRACAASERQGTHRRSARLDGLYRLSAGHRLLHRLADDRRHADAASAPAARLQPRRRRLRLDPAAAGARLDGSSRNSPSASAPPRTSTRGGSITIRWSMMWRRCAI